MTPSSIYFIISYFTKTFKQFSSCYKQEDRRKAKYKENGGQTLQNGSPECVLYNFFGGSDLYSLPSSVRVTFVSFLFILVRGTVPRFCYDRFTYFAWRIFLPLSLKCLLFSVGVMCFIFYFFSLLIQICKLMYDVNL